MNLPGCIVDGRDHGITVILCPREVDHFRRSWADHESFTAYIPHGGRDEEDYIEARETVRNIMNEGRRAGAVDFYTGGDINIEMKFGNTGEDLQGLDSIEWCGMKSVARSAVG